MNDSESNEPTGQATAYSAVPPTPSWKSLPWSSLGKAAVAALGAIATSLHFIGLEAYDLYLGHWGFDSGMLPLETSIRVHYGYRAVLESLYTLLNSPFGAAFMTVIFFMLAIQIWVATATKNRPPENTRLGRWLKRNANRLPRWCKNFLTSFGISGSIVLFLYNVALAAFVALTLAPVIGEHAANTWAKHLEVRVQKGCQGGGKHGVCTELSQGAKAIGKGVLIASSTTYLAYFDLAAKRSRLVKLGDIELTGWMP